MQILRWNGYLLVLTILAIGHLSHCLVADDKESTDKETVPKIGDAWQDIRNPVAKLWDGQRLDLWSLKSPVRASVSMVPSESPLRTPIDSFVAEKLLASGLQLSKPTDRVTFIRRVTFDLIGLPPGIEEIREFVEDNSADAYERLVDRLLSSPQYGVRWGRHWLDVVRYADTNSFERDEFKPTMWRYRDYIVDAFNADLPYDTLIREQLAGDEMVAAEPNNPRRAMQITATGFLRLGPWDTTKSKFDTEDAGRDELMVDLTNTTGSAFLGQTLACCRCHDHKTEPILHADHYRIRAFFAGVEFENEWVIDSAAEESRITEHNAAVSVRLQPLDLEVENALKPGRDRLREKTFETFPADIVKLLELPRENRDAATVEMLSPYLRKLDFYDEDIVEQLTPSEKITYEKVAHSLQELEKEKLELTTVYAARDKESGIAPTYVLEGGSFTDRREEVPPGYFSAFDPNPASITAPKHCKSSGRRTSLANWIASVDNPWTARVMVNRIWHYHFGRGIVGSPDDLGYSGIRPSHPELLDWLTNEFVESGWSIKAMHRLILLSQTYRQSSQVESEVKKSDPTNLLLSRQNMRRLDAEALRDSVLSVSGLLQHCNGGAPVWPEVPESVLRAQPGIYENSGRLQGYYTSPEEATNVRSLFLIRKRSVPLPFLQVFNLSDASGTCGRREVTNNAPQALSLLNNPVMILASNAFATRLELNFPADFTAQMEEVFQTCFGRSASSEEQAVLSESLQSIRIRFQDRNHEGGSERSTAKQKNSGDANLSIEHLALAELCRAILNSNEFIFVE